MSADLLEGIREAFSERNDLIVVALTGRTGSGCTTAAAQLAKPFSVLQLSQNAESKPEQAKLRITQDFARAQWVPFKQITVSSVIMTFLFSETWSDIELVLDQHKVGASQRSAMKQQHSEIALSSEYEQFSSCCLLPSEKTRHERAQAWIYFANVISAQAQQLRRTLGPTFQRVFQSFGDNVRLSGRATSSEVNPKNLFAIMRRVKALILCAESHSREAGEKSTRVVVDAIRNPLELLFLRDHYGSFLSVAITTDDETRKLRLADSGLSKSDITALDAKEYGENKHLDDYASFVSQNLRECIQKSDVFISNPGKPGEVEREVRFLTTQLVRYVALALRPGLVTPTREERCMQIAFAAKLNSGCISRQVGAAIADRSHSIKAVGWNDVSVGQMPCLLRDVSHLLSGGDTASFSDFEQKSSDLKTHLSKQFKNRDRIRASEGLGCPFCFKDAYNKISQKDNQVHTRALHAEENAFLQLAKYGNSGIEGGHLYTTASPCELCSKKALQLGIREIVFVDPYPGISTSHVLAYGSSESRTVVRLFSGAVGHAYHRLYDSILPIKDEFKAMLADAANPQLPLLE